MSHDAVLLKIIEAKELAPMDRGGTSDPYVRIKNSFNKQQYKTKIIDKTLNPVWGEEFKLLNPTTDGEIQLSVYDHDTLTADDFLGDLTINLREFSDGKTHDKWFALQNEPKKKNPLKGEIHLAITLTAGGGGSASGASSTGADGARRGTFAESYTMGRELGRGGFAIVYEARSKQSGNTVAVKVINKKNAEGDDLKGLSREIEVMNKLKHLNIVQLIEVFDEPNEMYIVMELVTGGELFDKIQRKGSYSEADAIHMVTQILSAIGFMHSHGIAHRDLKPENLLCAGPAGNEESVIKIADFGLAKDYQSGGGLKTCVGSPIYVAPEILQGGQYDNAVDLWSIGVITYILLCGFPPFYHEDQATMFDMIIEAKLSFPPPEWNDVSTSAKDFVKALIVANPAKRMSAEQCLHHPWLNSGNDQKAQTKLIRFNSTREGANLIKTK